MSIYIVNDFDAETASRIQDAAEALRAEVEDPDILALLRDDDASAQLAGLAEAAAEAGGFSCIEEAYGPDGAAALRSVADLL